MNPMTNRDDQRFILTAKIDSQDPDRGIVRWFYIDDYRAGFTFMGDEGVLNVDTNIPPDLRRRRYHSRIIADSIAFFRAQGHFIEAIRGQYGRSSDYPDGLSTNLSVFTDAYLIKQLTLEDAALSVPAGRTARANGFSQVVVLKMPTRGWNHANDRPAHIESLLVRYYRAEREGALDRHGALSTDSRPTFAVARHALHPLYLRQIDDTRRAASGVEGRDTDACGMAAAGTGDQSITLNDELSDHLYARFKSLVTRLVGWETAHGLSSSMIEYVACSAGGILDRRSGDGSEYTMVVMLKGARAAEGAELRLREQSDDDGGASIRLDRGDVVLFASGAQYRIASAGESPCQALVIDWWRFGRNFLCRRLTREQFCEPTIARKNREKGAGRDSVKAIKP
jgi:hypothetical protein